ncbi:MAG: MFS transporter [Oscillospiraceae bacterium]|jgi:Na+/melibiose symporter-like transporter|nr:MFS transporter [Oscillospiraceae bacterium]
MANRLDKLLDKLPAKLRAPLDQIRENEANPAKMKLKEYVSFALGELSYGSIGKLASDYLLPFYTAIGLRPNQASAIIAATKAWDAVNDPIAATIIDNGKGKKHGRFKPYLAPLIPVMALLSVLMFIRPPFHGTGMLIWCFATYAIWETVNTFSNISFQAIGTVMSIDAQERTLYSTIGGIGNKLSGMIPGLIPFAYDVFVGGEHDSVSFFTVCSIIFAAIGLVGIFTKNLKERVAPPKKQEHFWDNFVTFFKNKELILLWATDLNRFADAAQGTLFYMHALGSMSVQGLQWTLAGIPNFIATALAPWFLKRFRPTRVMIGTHLANCVCYFALYFLGKAVGYKTPAGIALILIFTVVAWIPYGIRDVAKKILTMNTFDYTAAKTGRRAEATSLMITNMLTKFVIAAAMLISGYCLTYIGFQSGSNVVQTPATKDGLFFMFSVFPAVANIFSIIPILFFKLEGEEFEERMAELGARNAEIRAARAELQDEALRR